MPQTISTTVYSFDELSSEAKGRAIEAERSARNNHWDFPWQDEYQDTLSAFCERFYIVVDEDPRSYDGTVYIRRGSYPEHGDRISGLRLRTYILNHHGDLLYEPQVWYVGKTRSVDQLLAGQTRKSRISRVFMRETSCPFTGFCADDAMLQPMRDFVADPTSRPATYDLNDLLGDCVSAFNSAWLRDCEWYMSDECIIADILANEYQFTEDGDRI